MATRELWDKIFSEDFFKPDSNRSMTHTVSPPSEISAMHVFWGSEKSK